MKNSLSLGLVVVLGTGLCSMAHAQALPTKPSYVKASLLMPLNSSTRDSIAKNGFEIALGYKVSKPPVVGMVLGSTAAEVSYSRLNGTGGNLDSFALQFVLRQPLVKVVTPGPFGYVGLGAGGRYTKFDSGSVNTNKFTFTGQALLGMDITSMVFVELQYNYTPDIEGVNTQNVALCAGVKF